MKKIVVATDLSIRSDRAVARAFELANAHGAHLTILTVVDEDLPADMAEMMRASAAENVARFAASRKQADKVVYETRAELGHPVRSVPEAAAEADLLILGLHRPRPFMDLFAPSTLEGIIRASRCTVLVVRDAADHDYERVLTAIDFSPACTAAVAAAKALAPSAALTAFHAYIVPFRGFTGGEHAGGPQPYRDEAEHALDAWATTAPLAAADVELVEDGLGLALSGMLTKAKPHVLALGVHGRSAFNPNLIGGFAAELLADPPCDLLLAR